MSPNFSEGPITDGETITLFPSSNDSSVKSSQTTYGVAGGSPLKLEQGEVMTGDEEWCKDFESNTGGSANFSETVINVMKVCLGTGILALPYAFEAGGFIFGPIAMFAIGCWNVYGVYRLIGCLRLIDDIEKSPQNSDSFRDEASSPPSGCSTFSYVTWKATGPLGYQFVDIIMIIFLLGTATAWVVASADLIGETELSFGSETNNAFAVFLLMIPALLVKDLSALSNFSVVGLAAIFVSFGVIVVNGLYVYGLSGFNYIGWENAFPNSVADLSCYYGVASFAFGLIPVTYNIQESMAKPVLFEKASSLGLAATSLLYIFVGEFVWIIYAPSRGGIAGDILDMLPSGLTGTIVRLGMALVLIVSVPLMLVPGQELIEGKIGLKQNSHAGKIMIRVSMLAVCISISLTVPSFALVLGLIGCTCTGIISFVLPALYHLRLLHKAIDSSDNAKRLSLEFDKNSLKDDNREQLIYQLQLDYFMLLLGIIATVVSTTKTLMRVVEETSS
eukprot:CAMPEP_0194267432 /NCGR_PEP_ID=MMETSP0169-20130528/1932_1 /TAXON_ID=218684 /ORGANISM="Corethron pennatum, Strain L29A3" /LENGTH=503 /DNA_ID=CAMNT_0039008263 /DNA_START=279 /DNA_END=1790 /DNA_ORIENTATION=-